MKRISNRLIVSAVASFVGKIFLDGDDVTQSSLINQIRKATGPNVTESLQKLRAKVNSQSQTRKGRSTLPDDGGDDVHKPKGTTRKKVVDSLQN